MQLNNFLNKLLNLFFLFVLSPVRYLSTLTNKNLNAYFLKFIKDSLDLKSKYAGINFDVSEFNPYYRAKSILTKEPDTIQWIDKYLKEGDIFYDIGANIGVFSLYAASKRIRAISFEPEVKNFFFLNQNISINNFMFQPQAFNIALNDTNKISKLYLSSNTPGSALHSFDIKNNNHNSYQTCPGMRLDSFIEIYNMPLPNHIKIDVDGNERKIITGMLGILKSKNLKTLCIEIDEKIQENSEIFNILKINDFTQVDFGYNYSDSEVKNNFFIRKGYEKE